MVDEVKIFTGRAHPGLAEEICGSLGVPVGRCEVFKFSNDNTFVKINESVREADVFVIQPSCAPVNDGLVELLIMIDALKRASVRRITAVVPSFPYARSDKKDQPRIAITARLVADLLTVAGTNRVLTMDLHTAQVQGFFSVPVDHLTAVPILVEYFRSRSFPDLVIVAPDAGAAKLARRFAKRLKRPMAIIDKRRIGNEEQVEMSYIIGDVKHKTALIVDDEIASGRSIVNAATALSEQGAREVYAACTHAILSDDCVERLEHSKVNQLVVTNTIPVPEEKRASKVVVLSVANLFAEAIKRIHSGESVSTLFED
ncbi:MAG: ribose-phosphate pyrophosphokinase [Firmicutes bacterium]|nr:ribose-phosphate pyrophosphokinase [Bacillota bacterium]